MAKLTLLRDQVYMALKEEIITGVLPPGQRIQEASIAARFELSKSPVREALARLVQEDLLELFPHAGYVVTDCDTADAQATFEFRAILEGAAAEHAARYATQAEVDQLAAMTELDFSADDRLTYPDFLARNRRFHFLIARAGRNPYLADAIERVFDKVDRLLHYRLDLHASSLERIREEHRLVIDALRRHDPEAARRAIMVGLDSTRDEALQAIMQATAEAPALSTLSGRSR